VNERNHLFRITYIITTPSHISSSRTRGLVHILFIPSLKTAVLETRTLLVFYCVYYSIMLKHVHTGMVTVDMDLESRVNYVRPGESGLQLAVQSHSWWWVDLYKVCLIKQLLAALLEILLYVAPCSFCFQSFLPKTPAKIENKVCYILYLILSKKLE